MAARPPPVAAVARTHADGEHWNTLVDRRRFFELALPVIEGGDDDDDGPFPPPEARLRLTSKRGYEQEIPVSEGVRTDDDFCSFRFYDVSAKFPDDEFTAALVWDDGERVLFEDQPIARHITAARTKKGYVPPFPKRAPRKDEPAEG